MKNNDKRQKNTKIKSGQDFCYLRTTSIPKLLGRRRFFFNNKGRFKVQQIKEMITLFAHINQKKEFRQFCKSLYPTCDLQQIVIEDKCYGFICYQAHR